MIIAVDPGATTGLAWCDDMASDEYSTSVTRDAEELWQLVCLPGVTDVVVEDFQTAGRISKYGLQTVRLVGGLEALSYKVGFTIHVRMPMHRYSQMKVAKKMAPSGTKTRRHEVDALAHLLAWKMETEELAEANQRFSEVSRSNPARSGSAVRRSYQEFLRHR